MRPVQYFTPEYLERCRGLTPDQILQFLDDFRQMHGAAALPEREEEVRRVTEYLLKHRQANDYGCPGSRPGLDHRFGHLWGWSAKA